MRQLVRLVVVNENRSLRFEDNSSDDKMEQDLCKERHNINISKVNISPKSRQIFFYLNRNLNRPQFPCNVEFFYNVFLFLKLQFEGYQIKLDFIPIKLKKNSFHAQRIACNESMFKVCCTPGNWTGTEIHVYIQLSILCTLGWSPYATAVSHQ